MDNVKETDSAAEETKVNETKPLQDVNVDVNIEMDAINDTLKKINKTLNNINDRDDNSDIDNDIIISSDGPNTMLVDKNHKKLTNYEMFRRGLDIINKNKNGDLKLHPKFVNYMKEYIDYVDKGGNGEEFMRNEIFREIDLSEIQNITRE